MDNDKDFAARVLAAFKDNLFEFKKLLFNLDDCVAKKDFDALQQNFNEAQSVIKNFETENKNLREDINRRQQSFDSLQNDFNALQQKFDAAQKELKLYTEDLAQAKNQISALENSLQEKETRLQEYAKNYSELESAYTSYKKLSANIKFALEGIFGAESTPTSFLAGALQEGHLESLFDYVATSINNGAPQDETEILCDLFDFAFAAANSGRREKIYTRLDTRAGIDFDNDEMRKTSNSAQSGAVKNVLLVGYKFSRTDKIIKKSLVLIGAEG